MRKKFLVLCLVLASVHSSLQAEPDFSPRFEDRGDWIVLSSYDRLDYPNQKKVERESPVLRVLRKDTVVAVTVYFDGSVNPDEIDDELEVSQAPASVSITTSAPMTLRRLRPRAKLLESTAASIAINFPNLV